MNDTSSSLFADGAASAGANSTIFLLGGVLALLAIALAVATIIATWKLYAKAGEAGWKSLIPIYNAWVFLRMGGQSSWWALVIFVPLINVVAAVFLAIAAYNIGLKLGKEGWWVVIYIFASSIWYLLLGFGKSTWQAPTAGGSDAPAFVPAQTNANGAVLPPPDSPPRPPVV